MIWMFAAMAAQLVAGGIQYGEEAKAQKKQNKAVEAYNASVRSTSARQLTEINIQRSISRQQTSQALSAARQQGLVETSARNLQAAASDTMGASVEQGLLDVQQQLDTASTSLMQNQVTQEISLDSAVANTVDSARNAIKDLSEPLKTDWAATGSALGQIGTSLISNKLAGTGFLGTDTPQRATPAPVSTARPYSLSTRLNI